MKSPRISAGTIIVSLFPDTSSVIFTTFPRAFSFKSRKNTFRSARIFSVCSKSLSTCPLSLISPEYFPLNRPKGQTQKIKTRRMLKPMELYFFPRIPMPNAAPAAPAACARRGLGLLYTMDLNGVQLPGAHDRVPPLPAPGPGLPLP